MGDDEAVRGTKELVKQAQEGLKLFKEEKELEGDKGAAEAWKAQEDVKIKAIEAEAEALTGKDNKKARTEKSKEASALKKTDQYIDADLVIKGKPPKHGFFLKSGQEINIGQKAAEKPEVAPTEDASAAAKKKEDNGKKKAESAGISKAERDELEKLKSDIIARKTQLKGEGLSGGQINKDEQVVAAVQRMNELKEKECPGSSASGKDNKKDEGKKKGKGKDAEELELEGQIEEYRGKLQSEFKYSKKEIQADPDMMDMLAKLNKLQGKK